MKIYSRNGILYLRINGVRKSTKLKDTAHNRKLINSYHSNDEFFQKFTLSKNIPKLNDLCLEYLSQKETEIKSSTYQAYLSIYKTQIFPFFDVLVTEVTPQMINNWYKHFKSKASLNTAQTILKHTFEKAILLNYIDNTPLLISKPKIKSDYEINPFSIDEMKLILSSDSHLKNLFGVAFFTGMRIGEITALKWSDIDFENNTINVLRTFSNGIIQEPKTKSSKAKIDLPIEAIPYFKSQYFKTGLREFVFYKNNSKPFQNSSAVTFHFHKLLEVLEIPKRGIHQTRHTFASQKLSIGERLEWVSFMLRHKSPKITWDIYYKYIPRKDEKRVVLDLGLSQIRHTC